MRELDADLLALEDRAALVAALGDQRDGLAGEVLAEDLERVQVGVRPEHMDLAAGDDALHLVLELLPLDPDLGEPRREHDGELRRGPPRRRAGSGSGSPTRIATRSSCSSMSVSALAQGRPATTGRFGLTKYTVAPRSSAQMVIFWVSAVLGRALESDAPTTATRLGRKKVSRSMERRAVGRPVMSVPPLVAVVPVAMSLPRAAPSCSCSLLMLARRVARRGPSGAGAIRQARRGPVGELTVYDVGVSVDPDRPPIVPGGGRIRRIVDPHTPPLPWLTDVSVFSPDRGPRGHFGRENGHRDTATESRANADRAMGRDSAGHRLCRCKDVDLKESRRVQGYGIQRAIVAEVNAQIFHSRHPGLKMGGG